MTVRDPIALDGRIPAPKDHAQVLVVGAGPAGTAAAIEAAKLGAQVVLVDENPLSPGLMGLDAPLWFGGRMTTAVQQPARMLEQMIAGNPAVAEAFEAGVDVRLGVTCWGLYAPGPGLAALPGRMVGLSDDQRSWMCGFDHLILATGQRDVAVAFPGWDQPGVMGAFALHSLLNRYEAFAGRRLVILGSGDLALKTGLLALERGLELVALVERLDSVQGDPALAAQLIQAGVAIHLGQTDFAVQGGLDGVERFTLQDGTRLACDTVCMALGGAPAIELLDAAGGATRNSPVGRVPVLDGLKTSISRVLMAGDCTGLTVDAEESGRAAARLALLGEGPVASVPSETPLLAYQFAWLEPVREDVILCQCETVTLGELLDVRAPAYIGPPTERSKARSLATLLQDGPPNQDQIKRLTRACMGVCQARRCREQVSLVMARAAGLGPTEGPHAGHRAPVRPLPLSLLADWEEGAVMARDWDVWFGIEGAWTPHHWIGTDRVGTQPPSHPPVEGDQ